MSRRSPEAGSGAQGRGSGNARLPESPPCVCAAPAGARGGQLPGRRAGERSGMPRHVAGPEGGGNGRGRAARGLGGRDGGTEDARGRSLRRGHPALWDGRLPSAMKLELARVGAVRRAACAEPICGAESWQAMRLHRRWSEYGGAARSCIGRGTAARSPSPSRGRAGVELGGAAWRTGGRLRPQAPGRTPRPYRMEASTATRR